MIACFNVAAHIDYCISLLAEVGEKNLDKLQRIQNQAARIFCNVGRRQSSSRDLFAVLHWLPVHQRTDYKLATLCFKVRKLHYLHIYLLLYKYIYHNVHTALNYKGTVDHTAT